MAHFYALTGHCENATVDPIEALGEQTEDEALRLTLQYAARCKNMAPLYRILRFTAHLNGNIILHRNRGAVAKPFLEALRPANRACLWMCVALGKYSGQLRIVAIQVVVKMNLIVSGSKGGPVNDEYRYSLSEIHCDIVAAGLHGLLYTCERPAGIVAQGPGRELGRLFDANTSMAEIAASA